MITLEQCFISISILWRFSVWILFTRQNTNNGMLFVSVVIWRCPRFYFLCVQYLDRSIDRSISTNTVTNIKSYIYIYIYIYISTAVETPTSTCRILSGVESDPQTSHHTHTLTQIWISIIMVINRHWRFALLSITSHDNHFCCMWSSSFYMYKCTFTVCWHIV